jgi:UDP-GlcNAc:undecaprenyl-phosphate/decaprenyl-phosphate GlcNAc-1-phosphate transferase
MDKILLATAIAFIITFAAIPVIIKVAEAKKIFDLPDERKIHLIPVPSLGGLGIFAGFILACLFTASFNIVTEFQFFFAAALVIFFLGLKDDIMVLSPIKKFIGQVFAAFIIIYKGGVQIRSMHGFLGVYELPDYFSLAITYLTVIVIINSFNLIDGVDGLASSLGLMTSLMFGIYFYFVGQVDYAILAFALGGSLLAFLIFNHSPARIFMGDTGSLLIGMINAILVIRFINVADSPGSALPILSSPAIGFAVLMVPLFDTLRVFAIRIFNRRSPFSPDRNHVHHLLLDKGLSHTAITYVCVGINVLFVAFAYFARHWDCTLLIFTLVSIASLGIGILYYTKPKPQLFVAGKFEAEERQPASSRILPIQKKAVLSEEK